MIRHYSLWDQIVVSADSNGRFVEYLDFLQDEVFETPVVVRMVVILSLPNRVGGLEMKSDFMDKHRFPSGSVWADSRFLPRHFTREFEDYLACGRLENGFLRVCCQSCSHEHLVAFSCKRLGFCGAAFGPAVVPDAWWRQPRFW